jgi:hypothetical protein
MGRHARFFAARGYRVVAVDRDEAALGTLSGVAGIAARVTDLEAAPWPFGVREFGTIVVTNFLYRPLFPHLAESLIRSGVLIYETFSVGNEKYGKPLNPDFLLGRGELLHLVRGTLAVVAFEEGFVAHPRPGVLGRICAVKSEAAAALHP